MTKPAPFTLRIPDADIADLRDRLARTRFPDSAPGEAWAYGTDVAYLRNLVDYWRDGFDWRAEEATLNVFPQFRMSVDGIDLAKAYADAGAVEFLYPASPTSLSSRSSLNSHLCRSTSW